MVEVAEERPPYVTFEMRPIEDRTKSISEGHYSTIDVAYALITPQGSRDRIERDAEEWLKKLEQDTKKGRFRQVWLDGFKAKYKAWKKGQELPESGTPILTWPPASPAQIQILLDIGIRTVEDLAQATEEALTHLGMGGRALKQRAENWLKTAKDTGKVSEKLSALEQANKDLVAKNKDLEKSLKEVLAEFEAFKKANK